MTKLSYVKTITTRDLVHRTKEVREALERGESFQWMRRGRLVAYLQAPSAGNETIEKIDWVARAEAAGAIVREGASVSDSIYRDRGE